jgi:hypothetical protein
MRIIGYLDIPGVKTTVFKMENRISVKFETGLYEQTFKFRTGEGVDSLEDVQKWVTPAFVEQILQGFRQMHELRMKRLSELQSTSDADLPFDEII